MNAGGRAPTELARRPFPSRSRLAGEAPGRDPAFQEPNMNKHITLLAFALATASTAAVANGAAQGAASASFAHTDLAPYTDVGQSGGAGAASNQWKGNLSRADVLAALQEARAAGTIPVGEAIGYPYPVKFSPATVEAMPRATDDSRVLGGPPQSGVTSDGYRFVGGEAGYIFVGRPMPGR
jgi:hypothetical protein